MAYIKQTFVDQTKTVTGTTLKAEHLNHIEDGIVANEAAIAKKQDTLVSGKNLKTVNGQSILGEGDLVVAGGESVTKKYLELPAAYTGVVTVEQNPEALYYGTHNIFALPGIVQGTFTKDDLTIIIEGSHISVKGTINTASYFNLVTGEFSSSGLSTLRYDVEAGTYRFSWKGSGTYACSLIIRSAVSGNKFTLSNGKYYEVLEVADGELGTPCLYINKSSTIDYSGNVCLVQGNTSEYAEETSVVNSFTGVGNVNVSGYVWSKDNENTKVYYTAAAGPAAVDAKGKCKCQYSLLSSETTSESKLDKEQINIYLPKAVGYKRVNFMHSISTNQNFDVWRINQMTAVDDDLVKRYDITNVGEFEAALQLLNRDDFSGGIQHGDEIVTSIVFILDGMRILPSDLMELTDFTELHIVRESDFYDPADHTTIWAKHGVEYFINKSGIRIHQTLQILVDDTFKVGYFAMFPILRTTKNADGETINVSKEFFDNKTMTIYDVLESGKSEYPQKWKKGVQRMTVMSEDIGLVCSLEVEKLKAQADLDTMYAQCSPAAAYNKLYYMCCGTAANYPITAGTIWNATTFYKVDIGQ